MVSKSASAPAALTQRQVDDLASGRLEDAAVLHAARQAPPAGARTAAMSSPAAVAAKEMQAIVRTGKPSGAVTKRIAEAARPEASTKGKAKAAPAMAVKGSAPTLKPPRGAGGH